VAQEFAKRFYKSKAWQECRTAYIASVHGLCERCSDNGKIKPGYIVHHTIKLTPHNINDEETTLNHSLLRYVCKDCHEVEHHGHKEVIRDGLMFTEDGDIVRVD